MLLKKKYISSKLTIMAGYSKWDTLLQLIAAVFIFLFVYTAVSKFLDFKSFKLTLHASPLITNKNVWVAWAIPLAELIVAALLFIPRTRLLGLYGSFGLLALFTLYLGYMLLFTPNRPCVCGGVIKAMSWGQHLVFNCFLTLLSVMGIHIQKRIGKKAMATVIT
jgi:putative oxidoreductase